MLSLRWRSCRTNHRTSNSRVERGRESHPVGTSYYHAPPQPRRCRPGRPDAVWPDRETMDDQNFEMKEGDVVVISENTPHAGRTLGEDAVFYEVFAPLRVQNLVGFIGKAF